MKTLKYPLSNYRKGPHLSKSQATTFTKGAGGGTYKHSHITRVDGSKKPKGGSRYM